MVSVMLAKIIIWRYKMKKVEFLGWKNCVEMNSGDFKLVVTTDVGPRVIGGFLKDSPNMFCVVDETAGSAGGDEWNIYGGHRLWHSPEAMPRTYSPDNSAIEVSECGDSVCFVSGTEARTGIHKCLSVKPLGNEKFEIKHCIRNDNMWDIEVAAWALSVMAPGGTAVVPQPQGDVDDLLPNRYVAVWPYTNMADKRLQWGKDYVLMKQDEKADSKCKFGLNCEDGWLAYANNGVALIKRFDHLIDAEYPDNGCSIECFTCNFMLEIETLSPLYILAPGEEIIHIEEWEAKDNIGQIETEVDAKKYFG
jgi:hypothetical protein